MKGIVYLITEKQTNKGYVGRTVNQKQRIKQHIYFDIGLLDRRISELGITNEEDFYSYFTFTILYEKEYTTDEEKQKVNEKLNELETHYITYYNTVFPNGYNTLAHSKVVIKHHNMYYYNNVETEEQRENRINKVRQGALKRFSTPEAIQRKLQTQENKKQKKLEEKRKRKEFWNTQEGIERKEKNSQTFKRNIIAYNKSEKHRIAAIESNKRRWQNGVSEETHNKMSNSQKAVQQRRKGQKWVHKDGISKMITPDEFNKFIDDGWKFGRPSNK